METCSIDGCTNKRLMSYNHCSAHTPHPSPSAYTPTTVLDYTTGSQNAHSDTGKVAAPSVIDRDWLDRVFIEYDQGKQPKLPGETAWESTVNNDGVNIARDYAKVRILTEIQRLQKESYQRGYKKAYDLPRFNPKEQRYMSPSEKAFVASKATDKVTRFEVIDEEGRQMVKYDVSVELSMQDDDRTLKVFLKAKNEAN